MIKGSYDVLKELASRNVCSEHEALLTVAWHSQEKTYVIRCGEGCYPDLIRRQLSLTQHHKAGGILPISVQDNIEKSQRRRIVDNTKRPVDPGTAMLPRADLGSGELLLPEQVQGLVEYARKYGLDPYRGHVVLMYGVPYFTIDAYLFHAAQSNRPYDMRSRPLTEEERKEYRIPGENDHAWIAEIQIIEGGLCTGLGLVTEEEMTAKSTRHPERLRSPVVAAHPWQLAQKRAEWQAMRRAFPIGESEEGKDEARD